MRFGPIPLKLLSLLACLAPLAGFADTRELSLRASIEQALANNFDLRIEREDSVAAGGELQSARAAYVPDLSLGASASHDEAAETTGGVAETDAIAITAGVSGLTRTGATYKISTDLASRRRQTLAGSSTTTRTGELGVFEITQPLLKNRAIDSDRLAIDQRRLALDASGAALTQRAMEVVYAVEAAYFDLVAARETVRVQEDSLAFARQTLADAESRLLIGTLAPLDARSARAEAAAREADLISSRQRVREKQNALLLLLTDDYPSARGTEIVTTDPLGAGAVALDYATSAGHALANRPELDQLDLALDSRRLGTRHAQNQRLPQLDLGAGVGLHGAGSTFGGVTGDFEAADHPYYSVGLTLTLPWTDQRARGQITVARAAERQAELGVARQRQIILTEVDDAFGAAQAAFQRITATRAAREYAESALEAGRERLAAGGSTAYHVLQLQRDLTAAQGEEISALADYNKALAALRRSEASNLAYWQIEAGSASAGEVAATTP